MVAGHKTPASSRPHRAIAISDRTIAPTSRINPTRLISRLPEYHAPTLPDRCPDTSAASNSALELRFKKINLR
jgi:hypothetical protein